MDFLDPRKRRHHSIRLIVGYVLVAIAISLGALILVYGAYGYGINSTGDVIQNGLLFTDSKPGGADIYLNGSSQNARTASRLVLPSGTYKLLIKKAGYRQWQRDFTLNEHTIARYVYPLLFPVKLQPQALAHYPSQPTLISQSPDHRWLLVRSPVSNPGIISFDEYDTTNLSQPSKTLSVPSDVLSDATKPGASLKVVEWSSDNKHLLLEHTFQGVSEFIIFDRDAPTLSVNINKTFNISPTQVTMRNRKVDQLYIYTQAAGTLQVADSAKLALQPLLTNVLAFKPNKTDVVFYVTDKGSPAGQVPAKIWDGHKAYPLYSFAPGDKYLIDSADFQGHFYYTAGSSGDDRLNIYKDPLDGLRSPSIGKAIPLLNLRLKDAGVLTFSSNNRFIEAQSGQNFAVYDIENQNSYHYTLSLPLSGPIKWMDGHRLMGVSDGTLFVLDYDSTNQQTLTPSIDPQGGFFDKDYNHLFTISNGESSTDFVLNSIDMRAGADLPKQ